MSATTKLTITEALSEIKLIQTKVQTKKATINSLLTRTDIAEDPHAKEGGSEVVVKREMQAVDDLFNRMVGIRTAISKANLANTITIGTDTRTIYDWLVWKREVAEGQIEFTNNILNTVRNQITQSARQPQVLKDASGAVTQLVKLVSNVDQGVVTKKVETLQEQFEKLDGQLSLKNATIQIEIPQ